MIEPTGLERVVALANSAGRRRNARALAASVGADALYVLVADEEVGGVLVPAPGFTPTLPGGEGWRALVDRARTAGLHRGSVRHPDGGHDAPAIAVTHARIALVFVGGSTEPEQLVAVSQLAPLLEAMITAELRSFGAEGQLRLAQEQAARSSALAVALDRARSDLESTLLRMEEQAEKLEEARRAAEKATRVKDEFLAMLGHELRNPLAPILTAVEILDLRGQHSRELEIIGRQVAHLMRLVDDLLDVSRITRGKLELRRRRVDLAEVARRAVEMASPLFEQRAQHLRLDLPRRGPVIDADPARMAQVVSNLLTNAARYSPERSCIDVSATTREGYARLTVRDEGVGLDPDQLESIFDQFIQAGRSSDRSAGGLGLGLAIVRSLVALHGGRVWAESEGLGSGSTFIVELPVSQGDGLAEERATDSLERATRSARVLVVDDNHDAALLLSEALGALGYEVAIAHDGPSALRAESDLRPEIVVVDIGLPVMDGYELVRRLRASQGGRHPYVIALTGYGQPSDRKRSLAAGFDDHLVKPVDLRTLQALLQGACGPERD